MYRVHYENEAGEFLIVECSDFVSYGQELNEGCRWIEDYPARPLGDVGRKDRRNDMNNNEMDQVKAFMEEMEQRFEKSLGVVEARINERFDLIDQRFDRIDQRSQVINELLGIVVQLALRHETRITKLEK